MVLDKKVLKNVFFGVVACIVLYWTLHDTERAKSVLDVITGVLSPFVLGAGLAFILNVPMRAFEGLLSDISNSGLRRAAAVLLTIVFLLLILAIVFMLLIPQIGATIETLIPKLMEFMDEAQIVVMNFLNENPELLEWLNANTDLTKLDWGSLIQKAVGMVGDSVSTILSSAFSALGSITGAVVNLVIGIVFALYCLFSKETLARQGRRLLYAFFPEKFSDEAIRVMRLTNSTFSNFLSG